MEILGYIAIMGIGLVLGRVGAGGSMLAIPVLVYLFSMDMETASAYSLFLVGVTSLLGAALKQKEQLVSIKAALLFGMPSVAGAFISRKWVVVFVPDVILKSEGFLLTKDDLLLTLFSLLMLTSSVTILLEKKPASEDLRKLKLFRLMLAGLTTGLVAGLAGLGGGFLILPALIIFAALPFSKAAGTSLLIIASNSLLGFCGDLLNRSVNWHFLFSLTALAIFGLLVGYWLLRKVRMPFSAQRGIAWFMMLMGVSILALELVW